MNDIVRIVDRQTLKEITTFGDGRPPAGPVLRRTQHRDRLEGNLYTTETWEGKRLQKFIYKGMGPVIKQNQGVVWPGTNATK
jgi:hypothetical protein